MGIYRFFLLSLIVITSASLFAQYDPDIDWMYIDGEYNRIIFPDFMTAEGLRVAALTEQVNPLITETMTPEHYYPYPVILTGNDMTANGYVTVFPRRTVWYTFNPGVGSGTSEWYDHLAVHEGRHTVQFNRLNSSTAHLLFLLGGESWYSLSIACLPSWIYEGDAIVTETRYTASGRGRLGSYFELMRSLALENKNYSYHKMRHHSYKDITPSGHTLGYPMIDWMEENYGPRAAESLFTSAAELPLPLLSPTRAVKKLTGLPPRNAYKEMMADLKEETERIIADKGPLNEGEIISPAPSIYTAYSQLLKGDGEEWYALKADLRIPYALYRYDGEEEKKLFSPAPNTRIDVKKGVYLWDSVRTSLTWTTRQESDLFLRTEEGKTRKLTEGGRYYHPVLSPECDKIAALEWSSERKPYLVILDREGNILKRTGFPEEISYASWPAWEGDSLILLVQNNYGEALWRYENDDLTPLIPFTVEDLSRPAPYDGGVFFSLDRYEGQEICYLKEGVIRQVTVSLLGADKPVVDEENGRLLYISCEGSLGDGIRAIPLEEKDKGKILTLKPVPSQPVPEIAGFAEEPGKSYEIKEYNPLELFSPVGWGMTSYSIEADDLEIPFALVSVNPMQTLTWEGGLYYNYNENALNYRFSADLALFLPHITTDISLEERTTDDVVYHDVYAGAGLSLPLGFTRGRDTFGLDLTGEAAYMYSWSGDSSGDMFAFQEVAQIYHSRSGGYRSLQSRFQEYLRIAFLHSPEEKDLYKLSATGHVLLPGLFPTHGTGFYGYYEKNLYNTTSSVPAARGWNYDAPEEQVMVKAEYLLPLFYPDMNMGGLAYFSRVSTELFLDRQWHGDGLGETYTSAGCELLLDAFFLSLPVEIRGGLQFSWLWERGEPALSLVIKGYTTY